MQLRLQTRLAAFERTQDRLWAGGEAALQHGQGEADVVAALPVAVLCDTLRPPHLGAHVVGDLLVQVPLGRAELVFDRVGAALGEQRPPLEGEQVLLDHAPHEALGVRAVHALAKLAFETVTVQQGHEQLEVFLFARVRRGRHQQEVVRRLRKEPAQPEAPGLVDLPRPRRIVRGHTVSLVDDRRIPTDLGELLHQAVVAGDLVHPHDQVGMLGEDVAALCVVDHVAAEHLEVEIELLRQLLPPLLHQPAGRNDDGPLAVRAQDQLLQVQAGHDRLACTGVVSQEEPQRDAWKELVVDRADLMRQRVDVGAVDGHHRVVEGGVLDAQRLGGETEFVGVAVERRSGIRVARDLEAHDVRIGDGPSVGMAGIVAIEDLAQSRVDVIDGDERDRLTGYEAPEALAGAQHRQGQRRVAHECLLWLRVVEQNTMGHRRLPYGGRVSGYSGGVLRRPPAREKIGGDVMRSFGGPPHSRSRR